MNASVRKAAVAGRFYPGDSSSLIKLMDQILSAEKDKIDLNLLSHPIVGGIVPHAGMVYSGFQAVCFYEILKQSNQRFDTIVIVNPNHSGRGSGAFNTSDYNYWETPLGKIETDLDFMDALGIQAYNPAHDYEHSGEVQLPFLQHIYSHPFLLVMITMNEQNTESAALLALKIHQAAIKTQRKILLIASSDFTHYESPENGFRKDQYVIDPILQFDSEEVYRAVKKYHVTTCGYGPMMTLLNYARLIDEKPAIKILKRGHSGEVYPSNEVVDYVSFLCYRQK
jgi:AmmeMemoRadiSam system protein B